VLFVSGLVKSFAGESRAFERKEERSNRRVLAVDDVSFTVETGELFTLLGPSGCGKTTTLRLIAGLEMPDRGSIRLGNRPIFDSERRVRVPANQRNLGMVFQSYAIWPHMTVFENVSFPLRARPRRTRPSHAEIAVEVERVLTLLRLEELTNRPATKLSGGQQQRLALARALVMRPDVLLLDEPLSNLDAKLRESLRLELKRLQQETGQTSVYVTHDQAEALSLSSRIAVMNDGKVVQVGTPQQIYESPNGRFVADFIGVSNFVSATILDTQGSRVRVDSCFGPLLVGHDGAGLHVGEPVTLSIRPENITLSTNGAVGPEPRVSATVRTCAYLGDSMEYVVELSGVELRVRATSTTPVEPGHEVWLVANPDRIRVVPTPPATGDAP
jgi:iron(III) transport system ATP-binding protein